MFLCDAINKYQKSEQTIHYILDTINGFNYSKDI